MNNNEYYLNNYKFRSFLEYYFALWLNELQERDYIKKWTYEETTFPLFDGLKLPYLKKLKTKNKIVDEHIFDVASFTEDFCIYWEFKSENIFYLNHAIPVTKNVSEIPFRLGDGKTLITYVDVKSTNASTTSSSVSYPYKAKWVYQKYGILIHKIYPFSLGKTDYKKCLFYQTFFPKKVIEEQVYIKSGKWGRVGDSKLKFPVKTVDEYLKTIK